MRTRVFQSGNSQAVRIPKEIQFERLDVEYEIERQGDVVISAITLAELEYGVRASREDTRQQNRQALDALLELIPPVAFDRPAAAVYAAGRAAAPDRRRDALDRLITSHAKSLNLTLVTNNLEDFRVYPDWTVGSSPRK